MNITLKISLVILAFVIIHIIGEYLYKSWDIKGDTTRKIVHTATGVMTLFFPFIFDDYLPVGLLCGVFFAIAWLSKEFEFLKSINDILRKSYGSMMDPVMAFCLFVGYDFVGTLCCDTPQYILYFLPMLITAFCDPIAAGIGRRYPIIKTIKEKSLGGFLAFFTAALVISMVCFMIFVSSMSTGQMLMVSLILAFATALTESLVQKGFDNLLIPVAAFAVLYFSLY
jgi:dolichol kinase